MLSKKEIGSKLRKRVLSLVFAPDISSKVIANDIQFISEDDKKTKSLLFNRSYEVRFFKFEKQYLPTIQFIRENPAIDFPIVKVDQGAVQHILNGADIFGQGITTVRGNFDVNAVVMITNPKDAILALGKSLRSSKELLSSKGKGILNIHYLGDTIWEGEIYT